MPLSVGPLHTWFDEKAQYAVSPLMPHPGAIVPLIRNTQFRLATPIGTKVTIGFGFTTHELPLKVDMYMLMFTPVLKSSKNACATPWLSMTISENCSWVKCPLTRLGAPKGSPAPGACASKIAEENAGIVAFPSLQGVG